MDSANYTSSYAIAIWCSGSAKKYLELVAMKASVPVYNYVALCNLGYVCSCCNLKLI